MDGLRGVLYLTVVFSTLSVANAEETAKTAEEILQRYVEDFRQDPAAAEAITFGIRITGEDGGDWHVTVAGKEQGAEEAKVVLRSGFPTNPAPYFKLDLSTLRRIDRGELNAYTAIGASVHGSDAKPMEIGATPGFEFDAAFLNRFRPFLFHFWTRGFPERVPFRTELSGSAHGANVVLFYYQEGFRSGWFQMAKGQHINKDPKDQTNPFPSMFIMIRGKARAKIGGEEVTFPANETILVPAGVTHEFWNPYEEPAEMILLMFGEGA